MWPPDMGSTRRCSWMRAQCPRLPPCSPDTNWRLPPHSPSRLPGESPATCPPPALLKKLLPVAHLAAHAPPTPATDATSIRGASNLSPLLLPDPLGSASHSPGRKGTLTDAWQKALSPQRPRAQEGGTACVETGHLPRDLPVKSHQCLPWMFRPCALPAPRLQPLHVVQ